MKKYLNYCLRCHVGVGFNQYRCIQCVDEIRNGFSAFVSYKDDSLLLNMISVVYEMENYRKDREGRKRIRYSNC